MDVVMWIFNGLSFRPVSENIHSVVLHISYVVYIQSVAH